MTLHEVWITAGSAPIEPAFVRSWEDPLVCCFRSTANAALDSNPSRLPSSESELVKNALHGLQGVAAAITALKELADVFTLHAADKTLQSISTLWTLSSSTNALAKLLSEFALAGSCRCELDRFVNFFLAADHELAAGGASGSRRSRRRRAKKESQEPRCSEDDGVQRAASGLLNQAFAAAIRSILQGHSASLNSLLGSLSRRRNEPELTSDDYGGALFGFGHGSVSLLELYLHTGELRMQLQALIRICLIDGAPATSKDWFRNFPRGADLLTHLYTLLLEPEPVHLGLLRYLFDRTFDPYAGFIRSCIYSASLEDPYGEFILSKAPSNQPSAEGMEQGTLKVRSGVNTPVFLAQACTQILRAAQQLEVLSKLPGARDYLQALGSLKPQPSPARSDDNACPAVEEDSGPSSNGDLDTGDAEEPIGSDTSDEAAPSEISSNEGPSAQLAIADRVPAAVHRFSSRFVYEEEHQEPIFFLSGYNKGTSWLDVGLPSNPFSGNGLSVYGYISTLFIEQESAWDFRSGEVNEDGLLKKLVPELAQVGLLSLSKSSSRKMIGDVNLVNVLLNDDNLPVIGDVQVKEVAAEIDAQPEEVEAEVEVGIEEIDAAAQGGGSWESSLKLVGGRVGLSEAAEQEGTDLDIPISVVVEANIVQEIRAQYRLVSDFTVRVLQESLQLQDHYLALRRYYFMEVGDWADNFITALCSHKWGLVCGEHHQVEAQGMLEAALQKSSCEADSYAERLHIFKRSEECQPEFVDYNRLEAFDFLELEYQVDWPLSLILTSEAFRMYKSVFRLLLRVKHAVFALGEISKILQVMERPLRKSSFNQQNRFRALQLFRHQIGHFVTVIQSHFQSQLLHVIWSDFLHAVQHEIKDMQDLETVHYKYLSNAVHRCFLSAELGGVKACIDNILQCLLDLRSYLKNMRGADEADPCSDHLYSKVLEMRLSFRQDIRSLHRFYSKSEAQFQLTQFWTALDFNGYFAATC